MREQIPLLRESIKAASMTDLKVGQFWGSSYNLGFLIHFVVQIVKENICGVKSYFNKKTLFFRPKMFWDYFLFV